jgi:hypothetical protein
MIPNRPWPSILVWLIWPFGFPYLLSQAVTICAPTFRTACVLDKSILQCTRSHGPRCRPMRTFRKVTPACVAEPLAGRFLLLPIRSTMYQSRSFFPMLDRGSADSPLGSARRPRALIALLILATSSFWRQWSGFFTRYLK